MKDSGVCLQYSSYCNIRSQCIYNVSVTLYPSVYKGKEHTVLDTDVYLVSRDIVASCSWTQIHPVPGHKYVLFLVINISSPWS